MNRSPGWPDPYLQRAAICQRSLSSQRPPTAASVHYVGLLTERLLEMRDLREWEAVDEYEIVLGPVAAHRKARELPARHDSRQADQGAHHVTAAAGRIAQFIARQEAVRYRPVGIGSSGSAHDDDLIDGSRLRLQLETKPLRPALDDPNGRFYTRNVTARFSTELVEAIGQILEVSRSVSARVTFLDSPLLDSTVTVTPTSGLVVTASTTSTEIAPAYATPAGTTRSSVSQLRWWRERIVLRRNMF